MTYQEQIKHPKWQKKRLEILQRDNYTCQGCGETEIILHVHHKIYKKDHQIWDYENSLLITFCEDCHRAITKDLDEIKLRTQYFCSCPDKSHELLKILTMLTNMHFGDLVDVKKIIEKIGSIAMLYKDWAEIKDNSPF